MKKALKILVLLMISILLFSSFSIVYADGNECTVTVGRTSGTAGDLVYVPVSIENNPGIAAITISVTYDSKALDFAGYDQGRVFTDSITLKEHPDKNYIRVVVCEYGKNSTVNDDILVLKFNIKESAEVGIHAMTVKYTDGDFANKDSEIISPKIVAGGVEVKKATNTSCTHENYSDWVVVSKPTCVTAGASQRVCLACGHKETTEIKATGHIYNDTWTVDVPATKDRSGQMSRHCKYCTSKVDIINYEFEDTKKAANGITNEFGAENQTTEFIDELFKDQYAGRELTPSGNTDEAPEDTVSSEIVTVGSAETESNTGKIILIVILSAAVIILVAVIVLTLKK